MEKNGSPFWQLVEKEHRSARAYCGRLVGNFDDGDDLYQDSVIQAFNGFSGLRNVESFRSWFYRIIGNTYRSRFRNGWWKRILLQSPEIEGCADSSNPEDQYVARRRLDYALTALSVDDRILVILAELEGWTISELAEQTSKSEGFVKMRLSRARVKMRKRLSSLHRRTNKLAAEERKTYAMSPSPKKTE